MTSPTATRILTHLRGGKIATRPELTAAGCGSRSQLSGVVPQLLAAGLLVEHGKTEQEPRKPPITRFKLTPAGEARESFEQSQRNAQAIEPFAQIARLDLRVPPSVFRMAEVCA